MWLTRGIRARLLWPLSQLFGALAAVRRHLYQTRVMKAVTVGVPVVVVGNIFIGGTGKTPFVIWLVQELRAAGFSPGVISRGFGRKSDVAVEVDGQQTPQVAGDEPVLIAARAVCPVVVGRDRIAAARRLLALHPEVNLIVSDDGLQHYRMNRALEIILFDRRGSGNGWLIPAGPLREPLSRRRDFTVVNGERPESPQAGFDDAYLMQLHATEIYQLTDPGRRMALKTLTDERGILAAAGIGNPSRFFTTLRQAGLQFDEMPLPDHYPFTINPFASSTAEIILITEKDAVKCRHSDVLKNDTRLWVVPVTASVEGPLIEKILERLRGFPPA